jgi:isoleucyl-tRNA synthetase
VELERAEGDGLDVTVGVKVERAAGDKCERCWKYTTDVGTDTTFPTICLGCAAAVHEILHG